MAAKAWLAGTSGLRLLIGFVLIVGILYAGKPVLVPLALAVLLAFILAPIVSTLQAYGIHRVLAAVITVSSAVAAFAAVAWGTGAEVNELAQELPDHKEKIQKKITDLRGSGEAGFARFFHMMRELDEAAKKPEGAAAELPSRQPEVVMVRPEDPSSFERLASFAGPILEPLVTAFFVVVMVIFMLVNREDLRNRFISLVGHGHLTGTTRAVVDAAHRVSKYLLIQLITNIVFGVVFAIGLLVLGVPYALLWGLMIGMLRFVPYIGVWIAAGFPMLLSFALAPDWTQPLLVVGLIAMMELLTANVVEPVLFGHSTGVTPIALLVAAAFWTWIWGPVGLILSTPLTVCLVVLGQHIPRLHFFTLLMGSQPPLKPHVNYYQRLLAKDVKEATQVAITHAKAEGLARLGDDVLLPALALARRDRKYNGLTAEEEAQIFQSTEQIWSQAGPAVAEADAAANAEAASPSAAEKNGKPDLSRLILGCPAHHHAEELSLHMLGPLLADCGCRLEVMSNEALASELENRIAEEQPALVFIPVLPPGGLIQARYLCKRLRRRFKDLPIVVGYWGTPRDFDALQAHLRAAGANDVTTTLAESRHRIGVLMGRIHPITPVQHLQPTEST
jgi:predicted PurR-regulated permease PerM